MDAVSFLALTQRQRRVNASLNIEQAISAQISAQGDSKAMKSWIEEWQRVADPSADDKKAATDTAAFLSRFGGGI